MADKIRMMVQPEKLNPTLQSSVEHEQRGRSSLTATLVPVISVLGEVEKFLDESGEWVSRNFHQTLFVERYLHLRTEVEVFLKDASKDDPLKIESIASRKREEINEFLQKHGFQITLSPFPPPPPPRFGAASVLDVQVEWVEAGRSTTLVAQNKETYPGVYTHEARILNASNLENPVVHLDTKNSGYRVGMVIPEEPVTDSFQLLDLTMAAMKADKTRNRDYRGLFFPKVSLDQEVDISWLADFEFDHPSGPSVIEEALQQTKFKMNEVGAHAKSAVTIRMATLGVSVPSPYQIDRPFVCWIERDGVSLPLFSGYIDYPDWKDPGSLAM